MSNPRRSRYPLLLPVLGWAHGGNRRGTFFFFHIDTFSFSFLGFFIFFFSVARKMAFFLSLAEDTRLRKILYFHKRRCCFRGFFFSRFLSSFLESFSKGWVDKFFFFSVKILICRFSFEKGINEKAHPKMHKSECNSCWWCIMWL